MSRKLALTLLWIVLGIATWDAVLDHEDYTQGTTIEEDGQVRANDDGAGSFPPK